jgi:transposase InsO family protein
MDADKVESVRAWPQPRTMRAVRGFLGLTRYYRKFIRSYGDIAAPLTQFLKRDAFRWTSAANTSFEALKVALTTAPVLQLPDFTRAFIVDCDASGSGIGAILHQGEGLLAFFSLAMQPHHAKLAAYERELIGLVKAVRHWHPYLWTRPFVVRTGHFSLKYLLDQRLSTIPQHAWVSKLFGYQFTVEFKSGKQNTVADALSRCDEGPVIFALSLPNFDFFDQFRLEAAALPEVIAKRVEIEAGTAGPKWVVVDDMVVHDRRLFVPTSATVWALLLEHAHGMGHEGVQKTLQRLRASFFTPGDNKLVRDYIRGCAVCQRQETEHLHPVGLLQPLVVPSSVWSDIAMDFVEGFPKIGGKSVILTIVDRFSKSTHFIPLGHPYSAASVAKAFFDSIVRLHGLPTSIVSDRDPVFTSNMWKDLFRLTGTKLCTSSAFHPQTDGQSEVTNRIIVVYLKCLAGDRPRNWLRWLPWAEYCYNTSYQSALKTTPFEVVYGRAPPQMLPYQAGSNRVAAVDRQFRDRDEFLAEIKERLLQAQVLMKRTHDKQHRELKFTVGDWVWLRLNHRAAASVHRAAASVRQGDKSKLGAKYFGPYRVLDCIGDVSYKLQLPPQARIHNVFHVSFLKKFQGDLPSVPPALPPIVRGRIVPVPDKIVRTGQQHRHGNCWSVGKGVVLQKPHG